MIPNKMNFFLILEHFAQMVSQQTPGAANNNTQPPNNNNSDVSDSILRSTFVLQPDSSTSTSTRNNEALRSRSADSRPINTNTATSTTTSSIEDDDADWIDLPPMDLPLPPQQLPSPPILPMPRIRGSAIIRKFFPNKIKDNQTIFF